MRKPRNPAEVDFASKKYVTSTISSTVDSAYIERIIDSAYVLSRSGSITAGITSYIYTTTAGQTVISGSDDNGNTLNFTSNNVFVNVNGVMVVEALDYTLTPTSTITMLTALSAGDQVSVTVFAPASSDNLTDIFDSNYLSSRLSTIYSSESLNIGTESIPTTSTSTGIKGTVLTDANYMYVCTAKNVWVRSSIDTSW